MVVFFTGCDVFAMIADKTKKATTAVVMKSNMSTVEDTFADVIQNEYTLAKERMKAPIFHMVSDAGINVVLQGRLDTVLISNVDKLVESDRFMGVLTQRMVWSTFPIRPVR